MEIDHLPQIAPEVTRFRHYLCPVEGKSQLIHGDFGGNVLFSEGSPPVIIDLSPCWRPMPFAIGVVIADTIVWEDDVASLIEMCYRFADYDHFKARTEL